MLSTSIFVGAIIATLQASHAVQPCSSDCQITVRASVTLDGVGGTSKVLRLEDGSIVLTHIYNSDRLELYSPQGRLLNQWGGPGDGPGEYKHIVDLARSPDGLLMVFDSRGRITLLDQQGHVVDTERHPGDLFPGGATPLPDGRIALNRRAREAELFGYWMFTFDPESNEVTPFGQRFNNLPFGLGATNVGARHIISHGNAIWAVHFFAYEAEKFGQGGERVTSWRASDTAFPSYDYQNWGDDARNGRLGRMPDGGVRPNIAGASIDQHDRLWVALNMPEPNAEELVEQGRVSDAFHGIIDVRDLETGTLLASRRVEDYLWGFADSGELISYIETPHVVALRLWNVSLEEER